MKLYLVFYDHRISRYETHRMSWILNYINTPSCSFTIFQFPGGGHFRPPPFRFSLSLPNDARYCSYLVTFSNYSLRTLKKNGSGQVRSPERVCWPHLRISFQSRQSRVFHGATSSLQVCISGPVGVICICQNFYICESRSGHSRDVYITSLHVGK